MPSWAEWLELGYWCCILTVIGLIVLSWFGGNNNRTGH